MKAYLKYLGFGIIIIIIFIGIFFIGQNIGSNKAKSQASSEFNRLSTNYNLLAKRIFIENPAETQVNFSALRGQLINYFKENQLEGGNLYFEYLPTGTSVRISGQEQLVAASLMKLPVAMNAYKAAKLGKIDLNKIVAIKPEWLDDTYGNLYQKGAGYRLSINDAIKIMLEDSDNTALKLVGAQIDGILPGSESSLNYVDIDLTVNDDNSISLDSKNYSSFLKCMYFSCYNDFDGSQKILEFLANSSSKTRLVAGLNNSNIKVAHKIGTNSDTNQSDCGIFYVPQRNYILCIMIPGNDSASTNAHFKDVSQIVYNYITTKINTNSTNN